MKCYLCENNKFEDVKGQVRDNPSIKIKKCILCGLIFLGTQEHICENFYKQAGMDNSNKILAEIKPTYDEDTEKRFKLHSNLLKNKKILDFGCGRGDFLAKLKNENITKELFALELNQNYHEYLVENFNLYKNIEEISDNSLDVITLFHVLEHLKDPREVLNQLNKKLKQNGKIIIEVPNADDALLKLYKNKAFSKFTYWSCHLYLFTNKTMCKLLNQTNFKIERISQFQRYSLANHLYWILKGKPGGQNKWKVCNNKVMNFIYGIFLAKIKQSDTIIAIITK